MKYLHAILKYLLAIGFLAFVTLAGLLIGLFRVHQHQIEPLHASPVAIAIAVKTSPSPSTPAEMYLDLLKKTLTRAQTVGRYIQRAPRPEGPLEPHLYSLLNKLLAAGGYQMVESVPSDPHGYLEGGGSVLEFRQEDAETMVGTRQLDNIQFCIVDVLKRKIPGDVIECGAWRGGATILMRAVLRAYGDTEKSVWVADSFEGLPTPRFDLDFEMNKGWMAASLGEVQENFARYGLLDERVHFLKGYFNKTLPSAPIAKLSVLRADGDLYDSQLDVLNNLYPKLVVGGYAIIDDYLELPGCKRAVDEYRKTHGITEEMKRIDSEGVFWQKLR